MDGKTSPPLSWLLSKKGEVLRPPQDQASFTRQCFEEGERFRQQFPLSDETEWAFRKLPRALTFYTAGGFAAINTVLRGAERNGYGEEIDAETRKYVRDSVPDLDALFSKAPSGPRVVYRYVDLEGLTVAETLKRFEDEGGFTDPAYLSTSASMDYPVLKLLQEPEKQRVLLEIALDGPVLPLQEEEEARPGDVQSHEHELLLPRGQSFELVGVERRRRCEVGSLKTTYLNSRPWHMSSAERKTLARESAAVPLVQLVQVKKPH